ncbi:MAG: dihydroneopterin aldolase [Acidobacteriota bacterium]|nr:MAG: dihydroneopterin aldolase [Acidobacteriota bacterium]
MTGRIEVRGIRFHAFHGLTRLERQIGVRHRVDVAMTIDISRAARSDRIGDTIDYRAVHDLIVRVGREHSFHLIETLAARLARELLEQFHCQRVDVDVHKETPVVDGIVDSVGVSVSLSREDAHA